MKKITLGELQKKIAEKIKGATTQNNSRFFGDVHIQHNALASIFSTKILNGEYPIHITNCNTAHLTRTRVDYLLPEYRFGQYCYDYVFGKDGLTSTGAMHWIRLYLARQNQEKNPDWALKMKKDGISLSEIMDNLIHHGYTSRHIIATYKSGRNLRKTELVASMSRAAVRHSLTHYDDIKKQGMDDYQIRELRRQHSKV